MSDQDNSQNGTNTNAEGNNVNENPAARTPISQRRRLEPLVETDMNLVPVDKMLLLSNVLLRIRNLVTIRDLGENEKTSHVQTDTRYIDMQLLRVVMPSADRNKALVYSKNTRNASGNKRGSREQTFGRMYLCRVFDKADPSASGELVYMMQGDKQNERLWQRDNNMRDNGTLSIGCYFRVIAPEFITNYLNNEVPMLTSLQPAVLMSPPMVMNQVPIVNLSINQSRAFVLNHASVYVQGLQAIESPCNGNVCDKQRIVELRGGRCACYTWGEMKTRCVFNHSIVVSHKNANNLSVQITDSHFTSQRFSQHYLRTPLPNNVRLSHLQDSNEMWDIKNGMREIIDYVGDKGGWTVVGWYRLGMVTDRALVNNSTNQFSNTAEEDNQVEAGETKHHVVAIYPTRESFRNIDHNDYKFLIDNRFNSDNMTVV